MFHSARITLTAWYLAIIMLISLGFSAVIFKSLTVELDRFSRQQRFRIERRIEEGNVFFPPPLDDDLIQEIKQRIILTLVLINSGILIVAGGLGYFLAGKTLRPIQKMVDDQRQFIADASHELRTPLTSLKTAMEVFLRGKQQTLKEAQTLIKQNVADVNALQSLTDGLLQLAQFQEPQRQLTFSLVSLKTVASNAQHKVRPLATAKKIVIQTAVSDLHVRGHQSSLEELLVILLDNAIKYSSAAGAKKSAVQVTASKVGSSVKLSVRDQGTGIAKKDLPHIFDRFYQAEQSRSKTLRSGYGLGLAIARTIVEEHRGSITVASEPEKGATFTVTLPLT